MTFNLNLTIIVVLQWVIISFSKTSFEKNCFSAWDAIKKEVHENAAVQVAMTTKMLNMGLINKVDMVCLSPVGYGG